MGVENKILFKEESYQIIGACMKVHSNLGPGFIETVYEEALEKEFMKLSIPFERQKKLEIYYDNEKMNKYFRADFICYDKIIVEIKTVSHMPAQYFAQLKNYLTATKIELGILINFGKGSLEYKRIINTKHSR
ncbi:GxxExxY protein [Salegentibacter echinorum]|uniref:GxxExxY protein n=1 Tax=Salegentibacter echinorum TaxID=1073325 RepID=A0A1M5FGB6_SALEC|nr:GxxExxY protein [Salegentibacter echinorum]SHF90597.1 GxxExxY protein [Salegentibacter echinorum]